MIIRWLSDGVRWDKRRTNPQINKCAKIAFFCSREVEVFYRKLFRLFGDGSKIEFAEWIYGAWRVQNGTEAGLFSGRGGRGTVSIDSCGKKRQTLLPP